MTMKKRIKTAGALTLAAITVLSAAGLSSVYGALGVETDKKCSLTFTLDGTEFDELPGDSGRCVQGSGHYRRSSV